MGVESGGVILPLVAEGSAKIVQAIAVAHQNIPEIMATLVAEVAEQRAIGLAHLGADALALGIVGFGHCERDETALVPGHHTVGMAFRRFGEEVEGETVLSVVGAVGQGQ